MGLAARLLSEESSRSGLYKLDFQALPAAFDIMAAAEMTCIYITPG